MLYCICIDISKARGKQMKKFFEAPEVDIIVFDSDILTDVIDTSPDEDDVDLDEP